jgi:hypothetical protein
MPKIETITFSQPDNTGVQQPQNYTQVTGIYSSQITPQFLNGSDNVQFSCEELAKAEQSYSQQQDVHFFRMR